MASSQRIIIITALACLAAPINAAPTSVISQKIARASNSTGFLTENGIAAQQLNLQFASLQKSDSCTDNQEGCISGSFAQCVNGQWQVTQCGAGNSCFALPLVNKAGTSIACDSQSDALARIAATGVSGGITGQDASNTPSGNSTVEGDGSGVLGNGTTSGNPGEDGGDGTGSCDGQGNSTSTAPLGATSTGEAQTSGASATSAGSFAGSANSFATVSPAVQASTIQLTAQPISSSSSSSDSPPQSTTSASTAGYYIKLNKRQLESSVFSTPLPTTVVSSNTTNILSSQQTVFPATSVSNLSAPAVSAPTLAGSSPTGAATVTVTVTATVGCTNTAGPSALAPQPSGTLLSTGTATSTTPTGFFTPTSAASLGFGRSSGGGTSITANAASSLASAASAAASTSAPASSFSTTLSSTFQFALPTAVPTTTANNVVNSASINSSMAYLLTATL